MKNNIISAFAHSRNHLESQREPTSHPEPPHITKLSQNTKSKPKRAIWTRHNVQNFSLSRHGLPRFFFIVPRPIRQQCHPRPFLALGCKMNGKDEPRILGLHYLKGGARNLQRRRPFLRIFLKDKKGRLGRRLQWSLEAWEPQFS